MHLTKSNYASTADILYIIVQNRIQYSPQSQYYLCDNRHQVQSWLIPVLFHPLHHQLWNLPTHFPTTTTPRCPPSNLRVHWQSTLSFNYSRIPSSNYESRRYCHREIHAHKNNAHARSEMARKYNKHHHVQSFVVLFCFVFNHDISVPCPS